MCSDFTAKSAWRPKCIFQVLDRKISIPWDMVILELSINKKHNTSMFQGISSAFCCFDLGFAQRTSQCPMCWWNRTCGNKSKIFLKELENKSKINNLKQIYIEKISANAFKINMFLSSFELCCQLPRNSQKRWYYWSRIQHLYRDLVHCSSSKSRTISGRTRACKCIELQLQKTQPDVADLSLKSHGEALPAKQFHPLISWLMLEHKPSLPAGPRRGRPQANWHVAGPHQHSTLHFPFLSPLFPSVKEQR